MSNLSTNEKDRRIEQIVAYLDGELSPVEASLVERQLAEDADFRQEMKSIERAWSALDVLPTTKVDDRFAQTTLELGVGAARAELLDKTRALPIQRRKSVLGKVLLATTATVLGLLMVQLVRDNPNRVLLADLPTIQYVDLYSQFRDVDFLEKLSHELGDKVWVADLSEEALDDEVTQFRTVANAAGRRTWITGLDEEDRAALRAQFNRFLALSPQEQERLRALHAAVMTSPESEKLQQTMLQYQVWLNALPASRQYELRDMPVDARVREIVNQVQREANNPWIELSPEEAQRLDRALQSVREQIGQELGPPPGRGEFGGPRGRDRDRDRGPAFAQQLREQFAKHREEWLPLILGALSEEHRDKLSALPLRQQQQQILRWLMQARGRDGQWRGGRGPLVEISQQELERYFVEANPADKQRLLALPREQMQQQLRRMYLREEFGEGFGPADGSFGPPPRGERGGFGPGRGLGGPGERGGFERPRFGGPPPEGGPGFRPPPPEEEQF
jgi:hypothetical protein